ncbi:hypothetical protein HK102_000020 [Quaeritorhiza haematococci]|nr:hypothetical protein HK102_000020 [Quaeritorhiza haematococci]
MKTESKWDELRNLVQEYAYGVRSVKLILPDTTSTTPVSDGASVKTTPTRTDNLSVPEFELVLLEGSSLIVRLTDAGFVIVSSKITPQEGDATHLFRPFESMDALLNTVSPMFRDRFHQHLAEKLSSLQQEDSDEEVG